MATQYRCAIAWLFGSSQNVGQKQTGDLYVKDTWGSIMVRMGAWEEQFVHRDLLRDFFEELGYTGVDRLSINVSFQHKYGSQTFSSFWGNTEEYEDGTFQRNSSGFSISALTSSPLVDLYLTPLSAIRFNFSAIAPGNGVISAQSHTITIESEEDIKIRQRSELNDFLQSLGLSTDNEISPLNPTVGPRIICDEVDSETGNTTTTTEVVFEDGFETSTTIHIINSASGAEGGDTLPEVAEQVEENEGDIFVLNNEVDDLQAGIYQLRRDNVDQDAYWEEVYVRVRDFSGRVRDEVSGLQAQVDFINNHQIGALNNNVQRAQEVASQANDGIVGLTFQLRDLMSRIEALENQ